MKTTTISRHKKWLFAGGIVLLILAILAGVFFWYVSGYYRAEDVALEVLAQFPEYQHWYMAGHSMGGAMASQFAADHPDEVDGLILLGAYIYGDYPAEDTLTIYGSLNQSVEDNIDCTENIVEIEGATTLSSATTVPRRGIFLPPFLPRNSRSKP